MLRWNYLRIISEPRRAVWYELTMRFAAKTVRLSAVKGALLGPKHLYWRGMLIWRFCHNDIFAIPFVISNTFLLPVCSQIYFAISLVLIIVPIPTASTNIFAGHLRCHIYAIPFEFLRICIYGTSGWASVIVSLLPCCGNMFCNIRPRIVLMSASPFRSEDVWRGKL